ncbi:hypothetical protein [Nostoc sp. DedQUE07]|uniref:hypothetical protein n=1 Tax=Nostoc sp. DedQUE07 TaxID=3075392 RepID=UPI002AD4399E|nr:hypothetical protein [Nostoc sp. DedQUE07]MDZ8127488.1 hypothetical protein [Nostoc sp. DedQUE07]
MDSLNPKYWNPLEIERKTVGLLLVVYLERSRRTRIISARPATNIERKLYEQG